MLLIQYAYIKLVLYKESSHTLSQGYTVNKTLCSLYGRQLIEHRMVFSDCWCDQAPRL